MSEKEREFYLFMNSLNALSYSTTDTILRGAIQNTQAGLEAWYDKYIREGET